MLSAAGLFLTLALFWLGVLVFLFLTKAHP